MINTVTTSLFAIHRRFLRSTDLERDWNDPEALENYTLTPHAKQALERLGEGLRPKSSLRAWRITGDYGSGKSSFALLVAKLFSQPLSQLPTVFKTELRRAGSGLAFPKAPALLPVLVTGSREPMGPAILRALLTALRSIDADESLLTELGEVTSNPEICSDRLVLHWVQRIQRYIVVTDRANGLLLILDEAGKFLEYAADRPDQQDVFLLQSLAEASARSGDLPLFILALLHQGVSAYTESLTKAQQREWEKVAGRFEEITWYHPVEQVASLVANALKTQLDQVKPQTQEQARSAMQETLKLRWYGVDVAAKPLIDLAANIYPLHPTVLPPLVRLFASFGQNERSLYSFLLGSDPHGLQDFTARTEGKQFFRLNNLFDYARSAFGGRLASLSYHWKEIDSIINSYQGEQEQDLAVLKITGLMNLLNTSDLVASKQALSLALDIGNDIEAALIRLQELHMLHFRGIAGGFCVWSTSSVNLNDARAEAKKALGTVTNLPALIRERLEVRPLVARRHYISTGNLRYFDVKYVEVASLSNKLNTDTSADGLIIVPLCETPTDVEAAHKFISNSEIAQRAHVLVAVPRPLRGLTAELEELRQWEWVERSIGELRHDRYAREEVSRKLVLSQQTLTKKLQVSIGLLNADGEGRLAWFHKGQLVPNLHTGRNVLTLLTEICNNVYSFSPFIHNELINRRILSSNGAAARLRLCEKLFESASQPLLGMDPDKHPPEMSMYLSVLQEAGLHQQTEKEGIWEVALPSEQYDEAHCRILPAMHRIHEVLLEKPDARVPVTVVFDALRLAPYGVRDGLTPLLLAVFAVIHEQELAFYEDGSFIPRITGTNFLRLIKAPETFEVQYYPYTGIRNDLFQQLIRELGLRAENTNRVDILDVVKPLLIFIANLPEYALKTTRLSPKAKAVRSILVATVDPAKLIFYDLPKACGLSPINAHIIGDEHTQLNHIQEFVSTLKSIVDELRAAYPNLLQSLCSQLMKELQLSGGFDQIRPILASRAKALAISVTEIRLKSFCLRLADTSLVENKWLESLGNLVCSMPPAKWRDADEYKFEQEIHKLSAQFLRVEAVVFSKKSTEQNVESVRLALTHPNGEERDQVIHLAQEQVKDMEALQEHLRTLLRHQGQLGMAAATRVLWEMMAQK
ncbi:hypothetical protein [Spirosoma radiotolerans]|uniref:ATP-binding protein n=1 Tax=Spirosoma radiotolerans TaxID=1379870 RepID=A0A0E3ZYF7_9BACT|nr:hypothetical protein [Spirosoma radiotolerans]AKD56963.1 hypothetical protein SD10_20705 [Spirosoma radiotolerans]